MVSCGWRCGAVHCHDPGTGALLHVVEVPAPFTSSCAFWWAGARNPVHHHGARRPQRRATPAVSSERRRICAGAARAGYRHASTAGISPPAMFWLLVAAISAEYSCCDRSHQRGSLSRRPSEPREYSLRGSGSACAGRLEVVLRRGWLWTGPWILGRLRACRAAPESRLCPQ